MFSKVSSSFEKLVHLKLLILKYFQGKFTKVKFSPFSQKLVQSPWDVNGSSDLRLSTIWFMTLMIFTHFFEGWEWELDRGKRI